MTNTRKSTAAAKKLAVVVALSALLIGAGVAVFWWSRSAESRITPTGRSADRVYTTRGEIRMLPAPNRPTAELIIHHEAIDEFECSDGTRGMPSMEMPFPPPPPGLGGFAVGDVVEFDLSVWYEPGGKTIDSYRVTRMKKLPPETKLKFGAATHAPSTPAGK
jgi:hypothetical protein